MQAAVQRTAGLEEKLAGIVLNDVVEEHARYYEYYNIGYKAARAG